MKSIGQADKIFLEKILLITAHFRHPKRYTFMRGGSTVNDLSAVYDKIYRYCFYKMRKAVVAEDITQETFLRFFGQQSKIKRGEDMAYLYTIAKNLCVDYFRKKAPIELPDDYPTMDFTDQSDLMIDIRSALEKLDEQHREIILLRYLGGLSVNETAENMGISRFAVYRLEKAALNEIKNI